MPNVGRDTDFERPVNTAEALDVFG
jgi:hypothetical protein